MRRLLAVLASLGLTATLGTAVGSPAPVSAARGAAAPSGAAAEAWPGGTWTLPEAEYGMVVERDVPIEMDDGAVLYANVGYPADPATGEKVDREFPVLLTQNPYANNLEPDEFYVSRGYIVAKTTVRGSGSSQGPDGEQLAWELFSPREAKDGAALARWAAKLDGSNGKVGLVGCSFLGINQVFTAAELGPKSPVKAMVPACASNGYGVYSAGGVTSQAGHYLGGASATILGDRNAEANQEFGAPLSDEIAAGTGRALNNEFWQKRSTANVMPKVAKSGIPALFWSGWDATEFPGPIAEYAILQNLHAGRPPFAPMQAGQPTTGRYQLIVGPWQHGGGLDEGIMLEWFDTWLKGADTGIADTKTPLHLYEKQSDRWVNTADYPLTNRTTTLHLAPDGALTKKPPTGPASDSIRWAPPTETDATLSYTTEPFEEDVTIGGPSALSIEASSSTDDLLLIGTLYDVDPAGNQTEITTGALVGSRRAVDEQRTWRDADGNIVRPEHPFDQDVVVPAGKTARYAIKLNPTLWSLQAGHSLRLVLSTQTPTELCGIDLESGLPTVRPCWPNAKQLPRLEGGVYEIDYGPDGGSTLQVPLLDPNELATADSRITETSGSESEPVDWSS